MICSTLKKIKYFNNTDKNKLRALNPQFLYFSFPTHPPRGRNRTLT